jgi:hypothetical protein
MTRELPPPPPVPTLSLVLALYLLQNDQGFSLRSAFKRIPDPWRLPIINAWASLLAGLVGSARTHTRTLSLSLSLSHGTCLTPCSRSHRNPNPSLLHSLQIRNPNPNPLHSLHNRHAHRGIQGWDTNVAWFNLGRSSGLTLNPKALNPKP